MHLVIVSTFLCDRKRSFDVPLHSFADWMDYNGDIHKLQNIIVGLTAFLVSLLILVQMYVGLTFLKLSRITPQEKELSASVTDNESFENC